MGISNRKNEAHSRYLAKLEAENREYRATIRRVRALADDWGRGRAPTAAAELRYHIEGGE